MDMGSQSGMTMTNMSTLAQSHSYSVICVRDYQRAKTFYQNTLGLQVMDAKGMSGMGFAQTAEGTGFEIYSNPSLQPPQNTTLAFMVKDFDRTFQELRDRGVRFEEYDLPDQGIRTMNGVSEQGGTKAAWFKDTEGNIFNLMSDVSGMM